MEGILQLISWVDSKTMPLGFERREQILFVISERCFYIMNPYMWLPTYEKVLMQLHVAQLTAITILI